VKTFYAQLSDGSSMKLKADRMDLANESIRVYCSDELIAYLDLGTVLFAQIYEKGDTK